MIAKGLILSADIFLTNLKDKKIEGHLFESFQVTAL